MYNIFVYDEHVHLYTMTLPNSIHIMWMLPQYFLITVGEILFSVTSLEFAYSQVRLDFRLIIDIQSQENDLFWNFRISCLLHQIYYLFIPLDSSLSEIISASEPFSGIPLYTIFSGSMQILFFLFFIILQVSNIFMAKIVTNILRTILCW